MPGRPLLLALAATLAACNPYGYLTEVGDSSPAASDCGSCHVAIYEEWKGSAHASSWTDEDFVANTSARSFEACLGCHAPGSIYGDGAPARRESRLEEGVNCVACHFDQGVLAGPAPSSALVDPHPVAAERRLYLSSELCGKCHEGSMREWEAAGVEPKRTCQDCHMPKVKRTLTQATGVLSGALVSLEDEYEGRRHTFHLDAVNGFENAVEVRFERLRREADRARGEVALVNRIPHRVPTGDFGFRRAVLEIVGLDARGGIVSAERRELYGELRTALEPLVPAPFAFDFPGEVVAVRARLSRAKKTGPAVVIAEGRAPLP